MPRLLEHGVIGLLLSIPITYFYGPLGGVIFFLSDILVDLDHWFSYYFLTRDWTWNLRIEYENVSTWWTKTHFKDLKIMHLLFLHRIEPWILIACFAPKPFNFVGVGALCNLLLDLLEWPQRIKYMTIVMDLAKLT